MSMLKDFKYHAPATVLEALRLLQKSRAPVLLAGGTFVLNHLKKAKNAPSDVIGLRKITKLCGIKDSGKDVAVGAMVTLSEVAASPLIRRHFPSFGLACQRAGTTPIRHMGTIGGNIASRFFWVDLPAVLLSLNARLILATARGAKTVSVGEFLAKKPSRKFILTTLLLPKAKMTAHYFRHTRSMPVDIPVLGLAFSGCAADRGLCGVRIFVNTCVSKPLELRETARLFERTDIVSLALKDVFAGLEKDLCDSRLDAYHSVLLKADLEKLIGLLKGPQ